MAPLSARNLCPVGKAKLRVRTEEDSQIQTIQEKRMNQTSKRMGLALSGGGFRAVLFHLGVIRFMRDAQILPKVTHITAVSGGSVIGAHLALNWNRYCGTDEEFDEVSRELIRFLQMDVRNRIVRRFPLTALVNFARRIFLMQRKRKFTRAGLLEQHYQKYLFGDIGLFQLPEAPQLYMLATSVNEGSICAFHKGGLLLQKRSPGSRELHFENVEMGLATVPMAVAASSAFPGFFPPLQLNASEVGANEGAFSSHGFTDGGIYDNLGLRMFRLLQDDLESTQQKLDCVLVSDAGATFRVRGEGPAEGLLRTALRSSMILMDRVNQLEFESFIDEPGVRFIPITEHVKLEHDASAPHSEVQHHAALIRTDMDRFSDLEISALTQHGYCVARQVCRHDETISCHEIPEGVPWNPLESGGVTAKLNEHTYALNAARKLQRSSKRRLLGNLFNVRDWPTYVWIVILAALFLTVPITIYRMRQTSIQQQHILSAIAQTSPLHKDVLNLLQDDSPPQIPSIEFETVDSIEPLDFTGYDVVSDDRIYDLRGWTSDSGDQSPPRMHARFRFKRTEESVDRPSLRIQLPSDKESMNVEFLPSALRPRHARMQTEDGHYVYETLLDFSTIPVGSEAIVVVRQELPQVMASDAFDTGRFKFTIAANTGLCRIWVLLPKDRPHDQFHLFRRPLDQSGSVELIEATTTVSLPIGSIAAFELINPEKGYRYEVRWRWIEENGIN